MTLPELDPGMGETPSSAPSPASALPAPTEAHTAGMLRTDLLHRHLSARVDAARETLEDLEARDPSADDRLVARFGALVAEAQQVLAQERHEAALRDAERLRSAQLDAARLLAAADVEARTMAEVAASLRQAPLPEAATGDDLVLDVRDDPVLDLSDAHDGAREGATP